MQDTEQKAGPVYYVAEDTLGEPKILTEYPSREVAERKGAVELIDQISDYYTRYFVTVENARWDDHLGTATFDYLEGSRG